MKHAPQFGGDEYFLAGNAGSPNALAHFGLVLVYQGAVNVPVSFAQGSGYGVFDFSGRGCPCA